jgi:hypothetical protein
MHRAPGGFLGNTKTFRPHFCVVQQERTCTLGRNVRSTGKMARLRQLLADVDGNIVRLTCEICLAMARIMQDKSMLFNV